MDVSLDCVKVGWGVLLISTFSDSVLPFFRSGDAELSSQLGGARLLLPGQEGIVGGEPAVDGGVTMQSSGDERMLPASNVVGLGDGHQPEGFAALWSRFGPHTQCLCLRFKIKAQSV